MIIRNITSALAYLEVQGIVHNDIKPANITYSPQRGAVLIDGPINKGRNTEGRDPLVHSSRIRL